MDTQTAREITDLANAIPPKLIDAIRLLRNETASGLVWAKDFITNNRGPLLYDKICAEFVVNKRDRLEALERQLTDLCWQINQLEEEIAFEEKAS